MKKIIYIISLICFVSINSCQYITNGFYQGPFLNIFRIIDNKNKIETIKADLINFKTIEVKRNFYDSENVYYMGKIIQKLELYEQIEELTSDEVKLKLYFELLLKKFKEQNSP